MAAIADCKTVDEMAHNFMEKLNFRDLLTPKIPVGIEPEPWSSQCGRPSNDIYVILLQ